ncbi:efflux RND transporter periplasmic adaptor subunit [Phormidesmis priestleyi ULC007]|uniref:Efflux RND transporter periplasmic adaptor subunit n=1 Tax=Phormidesmis priestleyi ULC007 TaxID=1920490 RepID=A0A2T1DN21_9CYAN|nr:efflux RND transporter periplasmic adaptor subunit [Phormidesmis priestleyi]PSB21886.1 efflux RND transporter periplasmic adaptor subunit [Phormidesmis priestleyi ULC007]PZO50542.1 MAG: efflux RND transporter periplasmic adaptor subunit [Phormidesmis priestleyi]
MSGEEINRNSISRSPIVDTIPLHDSSHPEKPRPPRWRRFLIPALIAMALLGGVSWLVFSRIILPMMMASQMKTPPTPVPLSNPKTATIADSSDYAASLDSRQSITLQPRVSGQVSAIYVKAGDRVTAGQPLLQIDAAGPRAQVASRVAAAQSANADIASAQADVINANDTLRSLEAQRAAAAANVQLNQQEYARYQDLTNQGASSKQILDQRLNALRTAQAALRQAEADVQAQRSVINRTRTIVTKNERALEESQANISEGQAQLRDYTVTAPFTGTIGDLPIKVGDGVSPTTQLMNVTQNQRLEILLQVPLERSSDLKIGLPVKLLDDQNREVQTGRISFVAPNVDATSQSVQAKATFDNPGSLRASQFVRARVIWSKSPGVLVPTSAISRLGGRDFLFVAAPFKESKCEAPTVPGAAIEPDQLVAAQKPIKLGKIVGNDQEVLEGISSNDRIVTAGILQLQNCAPIAAAPQ